MFMAPQYPKRRELDHNAGDGEFFRKLVIFSTQSHEWGHEDISATTVPREVSSRLVRMPSPISHIFSDEPQRIDLSEFMRARTLQLQTTGFVPVATAPMLVDPRSSGHRKRKKMTFRCGGDGQPGGAATPRCRTTGLPYPREATRSWATRRTHRMAYVGENVALRMPSVSAINSFSDANGIGKAKGETFDVPVSAQFPGGQIDGWVRVAPGEDGTWATQGLGFTAEQSAYVAESVQCVLESRRPSRALADAGDLLERRRQRAAELGTTLQPMRSSWIKDVGYD